MADTDYMSLNDYYQLFSKHFKKVSLAEISRKTSVNLEIIRNLSSRPQVVGFNTLLMIERLFYLDAKVRGWL
jgi:hypothetical protein